jgi:hypothetical protein
VNLLPYRLISRSVEIRIYKTILPITPCGGGLEYLHRSPASPIKQRKENPVPEGIPRPPYHCGLNTGTWSSGFGVGCKAHDLAFTKKKYIVAKSEEVKTR